MPTTYQSSSAINQKFTSGPIGAPVDRSFSNTLGQLFGPSVNFEKKFVSGSDAQEGQPGYDPNAVNSIPDCNGNYYNRIFENPTLCPPGKCTIPTLTSAALSSSCTSIYDYKYNITYNSGSSDAKFTKIEYSIASNFTNKATSSINNELLSRPPINISNLTSPPLNGYTTVYFRAFNECSNGNTSSYSNVLTASCIAPPPPTYQPFSFSVSNRSTLPITINVGTQTYTIQNNQTIGSIPLDLPLSTISISVVGAATTTPPTKIRIGENYKPQYNISASAPSNYSGLISTTIYPEIDSRASDDPNYTITTIAPASQTINSKTTTLYDLHALVTSNNLTQAPALKTVFASTGSSNPVSEVRINIDRTSWTDRGNISFTITPLATQYYEYNPSTTGTCVLSGTPITLADGSTTHIDNLRGGDRVLSPSIFTLPYDNNFDLFNWAINKLVLTEGTAVVTGNKRSQVSEVYSINNGTLTTTSTHQHLFKQNGTWNIKTTPYLMVGDYLSDRNGEEILIESIEILTGEFTVFDLDVEENDLYIANGILTHNKLAPIDTPAELP